MKSHESTGKNNARVPVSSAIHTWFFSEPPSANTPLWLVFYGVIVGYTVIFDPQLLPIVAPLATVFVIYQYLPSNRRRLAAITRLAIFIVIAWEVIYTFLTL